MVNKSNFAWGHLLCLVMKIMNKEVYFCIGGFSQEREKERERWREKELKHI